MLDTIVRPQRLLAAKALHDKTHRFNNIYYFICRRDWIEEALKQVLDNKGSGTVGIDGQTVANLRKQEERTQLINEIHRGLKSKQYHPIPVRRAYIPKRDRRKRPLGIPTIKDRVVQCLLKMLLEPIYESDFLDCSSGFRPMRRTMDCIASCYVNINSLHKYYWVVEGDIEGCFDHIHHKKLLQILRKRINDRHVLTLINNFLKAGIMEGTLFRHTVEGVPQGAIFSPLLANAYLHEMDRWWYENYHRSEYRRRLRRKMGLGNSILIRYADDFILLCNGNKDSAERMKARLRTFLDEELHLNLSMEKTTITHVREGFNFLGFHVRHRQRSGTMRLNVIPTVANQMRLMDKIRSITATYTLTHNDYDKVLAINAILRGWSGYYKHVSSSYTFGKLDAWMQRRILRWLSKKHRIGIRRTVRNFIRRQTSTLKNVGIRFGQDKILWLYRMSKQQHITKYRRCKVTNPFISATSQVLPIREGEIDAPIREQQWTGCNHDSEWRDVRFDILQRDKYRCRNLECGSTQGLDVHHIVPKKHRPNLMLERTNLLTLCKRCHVALHEGELRIDWL